ncbi:MAG: N-acetylmuramoyl-L-alanine amidase [Clostridia bacterium]|nr:N-acetylmuramoyl-L-alanine amidase [Clostridia bacterium]
MIAVIKKKTIIVCLVVIVAIAVAVGAGAVVKASTLASISLGKTVVIDAGHGGIDGGVSGVNSGIKESQINLAIAKSLKNYLP